MTSIDIKTPGGDAAGSVELPAEVFNVQTNVPLIHQVVCGATGCPGRGHTRRRPAPRSPVVAASRTGRRAPAAPVRVRYALRSSPAVVWSMARRRAATRRRPPRR